MSVLVVVLVMDVLIWIIVYRAQPGPGDETGHLLKIHNNITVIAANVAVIVFNVCVLAVLTVLRLVRY